MFDERMSAVELDDFKIIKEGEAEILMHAKNEVFFNKAQVPKSLIFHLPMLKQLVWGLLAG